MEGIYLKKYRIVCVFNTYNRSFSICRWNFFLIFFNLEFHEEERIFIYIYIFLYFLLLFLYIHMEYIFVFLHLLFVLNCYIFSKRIYFSIFKFVFILYFTYALSISNICLCFVSLFLSE